MSSLQSYSPTYRREGPRRRFRNAKLVGMFVLSMALIFTLAGRWSTAAAAPVGQVFLTATGGRDVLRAEHFAGMTDGAVLANAGHFDVEIDLAGLRGLAAGPPVQVRPQIESYRLADGRRLLLLAEGRLVNLSAADGHPAAVMDVSFGVQALTVEHLATAELAPGVHEVPPAIDTEVARTRLEAGGVGLDVLTPAQETYLSGWSAVR